MAAEPRLRPRPPILYPLRLPSPRPFGAPIHLGKGRPLLPSRDIRRGVLLGRWLHPRPRGRRPVAGGPRSAEVDPEEGMKISDMNRLPSSIGSVVLNLAEGLSEILP